MMSRKSIIAFPSCCQFQSICFPNAILIPAGQSYHSPSRKPDCYRHLPKRGASRRQYATHDTPSSAFSEPTWPEMPTPSAVPTPYQIFQLKEKAPYSKRRFYELVKLYHPDRHGQCYHVPGIDSLSQDTKMKRYRLVVAANNILSDPARRTAYDHFGAGWNSHPDIGGATSSSNPNMRQRWSGFHDNNSPARNATWEDWERWYERNSKDAQAPVYTSNGGFISLVAFVVALSAMSQASRVDEHQQYFADRIELVHNDSHTYIQRRKDETKELSNADLAILRFMRSREQGGIPAGCGVPHPDDLNQEGLFPSER